MEWKVPQIMAVIAGEGGRSSNCTVGGDYWMPGLRGV
jgi:hypothetical protein